MGGYSSIYTLLKSVSDNIGFDVEFQHGRGTDINIFADNNKSIMIWLSPLRSSNSFISSGNRLLRAWTIELTFYQRDTVDSTNDETLSILQTTDKIIEKYFIDLNNKIATIDNGYYDVEVTGLSITPVIKVLSHILTGHICSFNISLPDDFNYC